MRSVYRIRRSFLVPFAVTTALVAILFLLSVFVRGFGTERVVLAILVALLGAALGEFLHRQVVADDLGLTIRKFYRVRELRWEHVTHVGTVVVRGRAYILLTTLRGFHVVSNAYDDFSRLLNELATHGGNDKVEEEVRSQIAAPVVNRSDVVAAWVAAAVTAGLIVLKLMQG